MTSKKLLGFIGAGKMGEALIRGILANKSFGPAEIVVFDVSEERVAWMRQCYGVRALSFEDLLEKCQLVFFSIKPQKFSGILDQIRKQFSPKTLYVSIMAGISIDRMRQIHEAIKVVRAMPNLPVQVSMGVTALASSNNISSEDMSLVESLFQSVGKTIFIQESKMDIVTALSGSGPAFVFRFVQALIMSGQAHGLSLADATALVYETFRGSGELLLSCCSKSCEEWIKEVSSKGGTTVAGLKVLDEFHFDQMMNQVVLHTKNRSKKLGDLQ